MPFVRDIIGSCNTGLARGLNLQVIHELNVLIPNVLVAISDLDINLAGEQINPFLQPQAKESLKLAIAEKPGEKMIVNSVYRTCVQQYLVWSQHELGLCGITKAAQVGTSNHESGLALDLADPNFWEPVMEKHAWHRLGRDFDYPHFDYVFRTNGVRRDLGSLGIKAFQRLWNKHNPGSQIAEDGFYGPLTASCISNSPVEGF